MACETASLPSHRLTTKTAFPSSNSCLDFDLSIRVLPVPGGPVRYTRGQSSSSRFACRKKKEKNLNCHTCTRKCSYFSTMISIQQIGQNPCVLFRHNLLFVCLFFVCVCFCFFVFFFFFHSTLSFKHLIQPLREIRVALPEYS